MSMFVKTMRGKKRQSYLLYLMIFILRQIYDELYNAFRWVYSIVLSPNEPYIGLRSELYHFVCFRSQIPFLAKSLMALQ